MSDFAIRVEGLSKRYRIGKRESYRTLRDSLSAAFAAPWRLLRRRGRAEEPTIWALKNLSFSVEPGEVLGIIGPNGAGKSTLLKLLSRITRPTEGWAEIRGRVRSLLEVGTGFHPELTGRENIYLNGAILGMSRAEIASRFDEIVAFAEVKKFIDTAVKHFSTGMYLRLAFAVAAHLRSEILLVDEVLAVGDAAFQKKCLGKMSEVAHEGRTVLFVSHNMAAVRSLCRQGILLDHGTLAFRGDVERVLFEYTRRLSECQASDGASGTELSGVSVDHRNPGTIESGRPFAVEARLHLPAALPGFRLFCIIQDANGEALVVVPTNHRQLEIAATPGWHDLRVEFPGLWLRPGVYSVHFKLLGTTVNSGSARVLSESVMLDVAGTGDPEMLLGYLTPEVIWSADGKPCSEAVCS